jgi:hypothetical protein
MTFTNSSLLPVSNAISNIEMVRNLKYIEFFHASRYARKRILLFHLLGIQITEAKGRWTIPEVFRGNVLHHHKIFRLHERYIEMVENLQQPNVSMGQLLFRVVPAFVV